MLRCQWRMIGDPAKKLNRALRFKPVPVLERLVAMKCTLSILKTEPSDAKGGDIVADNLCSTRKAQQDVGRCIVTEGYGHLQKCPQRYLDARIGIFVLQGAIGLGQNTVLWQKAYWLVQRELSLLYLMQDRQCQWQFEDGLHWRVRSWVEIAVQRSTGQRASHGYLSMRVRGNGTNLLLERRLRDCWASDESKEQVKAHEFSLGHRQHQAIAKLILLAIQAMRN